LWGDTLQQESQRLNISIMYSKMHVLVDLPMTMFYCTKLKCRGKFTVATHEKSQLIMANAHTCPICGEFCEASRFRKIRT